MPAHGVRKRVLSSPLPMLTTLLLCLTLLPHHAAADDAPPQSVRLEVVARTAVQGTILRASTTWLGATRELDLKDDGSGADQSAGDGVWTGVWTGDAVSALPLELQLFSNQGNQVLFSGTEIIRSPDETLTWALHLGPPMRAERTALPLAVAEVSRSETVQVMAALGWMLVVLNYLGWLALPYIRREAA